MSKRSSMAPVQCPLSIAAQTIVGQAPYVKNGTVTIKLSLWYDNYVGDVMEVIYD